MLKAKYAFEAIGTQWTIETVSPISGSLRERIQTLIADFSQTYSRFDRQSLVSKARQNGVATLRFPSSIRPIYDFYAALNEATSGKINPLVGTSLEQLGYDADYSLTEYGRPQPAPAFGSLSLKVTSLSFATPALLDIGAVGKGFLIDEISALLRDEHGEYVVDGSGDIKIHTEEPQTIGLEDPRDPKRVLGVMYLKNMSLCASATNRRAWGNHHHIIDAATGDSAKTDVVATWAVTDAAMNADGLASALFFTPANKLMDRFGPFYYVILTTEGHVHHNINAIGELYT